MQIIADIVSSKLTEKQKIDEENPKKIKSKEIKGIDNEYIFLSNEHMFKLNKKKNGLI